MAQRLLQYMGFLDAYGQTPCLSSAYELKDIGAVPDRVRERLHECEGMGQIESREVKAKLLGLVAFLEAARPQTRPLAAQPPPVDMAERFRPEIGGMARKIADADIELTRIDQEAAALLVEFSGFSEAHAACKRFINWGIAR